MRHLILILCFLSAGLFATSTPAAIVTFQQGSGGYSGSEAASFSTLDANYEDATKLYFRNNFPNALYFPLIGIPAGSTINSATLQVYVYEEYNNTQTNIQCGYVTDPNGTGAWHDRGSNSEGSGLGATMAKKDAATTVYWNNAQNQFTGVMSAVACGQTDVQTTGWKSWSAASVVQGWLAGSYPNRGFWLREAAGSNSNARASAKYDANATQRPKLTIDYTPPTSPPGSAPTLNAPTAGSQTVSLTWSTLAAVDGYKVRYGTTPGTYPNTIDAGNAAQYTVTGLTNGTTYYFAVAAYNYAGDGPNSSPQNATPHYAPAAQTVTLQEGINGVTGTQTVSLSTFDANYSDSTKLYFRYNYPSAVYFPVSSYVTAGSTINAATLQVYVYEEYNTVTTNVQCGYVTDPNGTGSWQDRGSNTEGSGAGATMAKKNAATTVYWDNAQHQFTSVMSAQACGQADVQTTGWKSWNAAPVVQGWLAGSYPNRGFWLREASGANSNARVSGKYDGTAAQRPKLTIIFTPAVTPPAGVAVLNGATAGPGSVGLSWSSVSDADGYKIKYGTAPGTYTATADAGSATSYALPGLTNGTTYYVVVLPYNTAGDGGSSNEVSATPQPPAPSAPVLNTVTPGDQSAAVSWSAVAGAAGYKIRYGISPGAYGAPIDAGNATSYLVTGLTNGTTYYVVVTAYNGGGESGVSNEMSAMPQVPAPNAPSLSSAVPGNAAVTLTWGAVSGAAGYHVQYGTASGSYGAPVDAGNVLSYPVSGLNNGTMYYFVVTAYNAGGESGVSNELSALPQNPAPAAPSLNSVVAGDHAVTLVWGAVAGAGSYTIKYGTSAGVYTATIPAGAATSYQVINLTNGTTYYFVVTAVGAGGESLPSNAMPATPHTVTLSYTADLTTGGTSSASSCLSGCAGTYSHTKAFDNIFNVPDGWVSSNTQSGWLEYQFSAAKTIAKYTINPRAQINGNPKSWTFEGFNAATGQWVVLDTRVNYASWVYQTTREFSVLNTTSYTRYRLNISANGGHVEVGLTEMEMMELISAGSPSAVSDLAAQPDNGKVALTWTAPSANGAAITGYQVQYGAVSSGNFATLVMDDAVPGAMITGLTNGRAYQFRVIAINANGTSVPSNVATATPLGGSFSITGNAVTNRFFDPRRSETALITYDLQTASDVTVEIFTYPAHTLVRTLLAAQPRTAGVHSEAWDGWNDSAAALPAGTYTYEISAVAPDMSIGVYAPAANSGIVPVYSAASMVPSSGFTPVKGERLAVNYILDRPGLVTMEVGSVQVLTDLPRNAGANTERWEGRTPAGLIEAWPYGVPVRLYTAAVPPNIIQIVHRATLDIDPVSADPYVIQPLHNDVTQISYTLNEAATVTVQILTPDGATVLRSVETAAAKGAGTYSFEWDGRTDAGKVVAEEGNYRVRIAAVDALGGTVVRDGNIRILF